MNNWILASLAFLLSTNMAHSTSIVSQPDGAQMVLIPAGPFIYGADQREIKTLLRQLRAGWAEIYGYEHPRQTLTLPTYYIDRYEVSNARYNRFVEASRQPSQRFKNYPQLNDPMQPVVGIGWNVAAAYCRWSGKRLPTEEEWEKAARGTDGRTWPWGNTPNAMSYNGRWTEFFAPVATGSYPQSDSPFGVADMAGNIWEMTASTWPDGRKVMRGGSFLNSLAEVRVTVRWAASDEVRGANWLGFRCAMDVK